LAVFIFFGMCFSPLQFLTLIVACLEN